MPSINVLRQMDCNLPILLLYYVFPFIALFAKILGFGPLNYDFVWVLLCLIACFVCLNRKFKKKDIIILGLFEIIITLKYIFPIWWTDIVIYRPLIMDGKWVIYFIFVFLWTRIFSYPSYDIFYKGALFFCKFYIICAVVSLFTTYTFRYSLLSESNYDCFLFLIGFCFIPLVKHKRKDYFIFFMGTVLSGSQTGLASFLMITLIILWKSKPKLVIVLLPFGIVMSYLLFKIRRGDNDVSSLDRVIFIMQAVDFFAQNNIFTFMFGTFPGEPLKMETISGFDFFVEKFEEMNNISGCYAFYFHSTYLRFAISWGIPFLIVLLGYSIYMAFTTKNISFRLLIFLTLVQSLTLSSLTLTSVSVVLFTAMMTLFKYRFHPFHLR